MTATTETALPPLDLTELDDVPTSSARVSHGVCEVCWPDSLDPAAVALCGRRANLPGTASHLCAVRAFTRPVGLITLSCGCVPCKDCAVVVECPVCEAH